MFHEPVPSDQQILALCPNLEPLKLIMDAEFQRMLNTQNRLNDLLRERASLAADWNPSVDMDVSAVAIEMASRKQKSEALDLLIPQLEMELIRVRSAYESRRHEWTATTTSVAKIIAHVYQLKADAAQARKMADVEGGQLLRQSMSVRQGHTAAAQKLENEAKELIDSVRQLANKALQVRGFAA